MALTDSMLSLLVLLASSFTAAAYLRQSPIISHLRHVTEPDVIPIGDTNDGPLAVDISLSLVKILKVDRDRDEIEILVRQELSWRNPALAWNVSHGGFHETRVSLSTQYLWLPDITIYNAVTAEEVLSPNAAVVFSEGDVFYHKAVRVRVYCDLHHVATFFGAECELKFGSWTHTSQTILLANQIADTITIHPNQDYEIRTSRSESRFGKVSLHFDIRSVIHGAVYYVDD